MSHPESPNRILLACFLGVAVFGLLTVKDMVVAHLSKDDGQPESSIVQITPYEELQSEWPSVCPDPVETDTIAQLRAKLLACRTVLEKLSDKVHDEFDLD